MTLQNLPFHHGDEVVVLDTRGEYVTRGKVVGCHACATNLFDVQPARTQSLFDRLHAIPETRLRRVSKAIQAYEGIRLVGPVHVKDHA